MPSLITSSAAVSKFCPSPAHGNAWLDKLYPLAKNDKGIDAVPGELDNMCDFG